MEFKIEMLVLVVLLSVSMVKGAAEKGATGRRLHFSKYLSPKENIKLEDSLLDLASDDEVNRNGRFGEKDADVLMEDEVEEQPEQFFQHEPELMHLQNAPKLVEMLSQLDFTEANMKQFMGGAAAGAGGDSLRSGFAPVADFFKMEPVWDRTLERLTRFAEACAKLKQLSLDIAQLLRDNDDILKNMVKDTDTNFVGYYN